MQTDNICQFIPFHKDYHSLHTINFVLETSCKRFSGLKSEAMNKIHLVTEGEGVLHTIREQIPLARGTVFFTFPSFPFAIEAKSGSFKYMYISFLGERGNMLLEQLKINAHNLVFRGLDVLEDFWKICIDSEYDGLVLKSESALLYSFGVLSERLLSAQKSGKKNVSVPNLVKKYIDDNYIYPKLTLKQIGEELKYNQKYLSSAFKSEMGIGISKYLNTVRIQHACALIDQGFESISDICYQCGFSDPQYFTEVFKKHMGETPREHIQAVRGKRRNSANFVPFCD